jgi:hypothetical protein
MFARFFALLVALSVMASTLTACGGGVTSPDDCDPDNNVPCAPAPAQPPPVCSFPDGLPQGPSVIAPPNTLALGGLSQITFTVVEAFATADSYSGYVMIVSRSSTADAITNGKSPFAATGGFVQVPPPPGLPGVIALTATLQLPNPLITPNSRYFAYLSTTGGCAAAGPIDSFST